MLFFREEQESIWIQNVADTNYSIAKEREWHRIGRETIHIVINYEKDVLTK